MALPAVRFLTVEAVYSGQRLDNFLVSRLNGLPKSRLYRLLRKGEIRVNKKRKPPYYRLQTGDAIRIPPLRLSEAHHPLLKPCQRLQALLAASVIFEDDKLLIINKPTGIAVHGGSGTPHGVIETMQQLRSHGRFLELAHRLDRETSGCLLMAKKSSVLKELHALLRAGEVEKTYLALVGGHWPQYLHEIAEPLQRSRWPSGQQHLVRVNTAGKPALTRFRVIARFASSTLVEARPQTGRTHQIRVHTQHAHHPIVGDKRYGEQTLNETMRKLGCKRLFLHASELKLRLPNHPQAICVKAELAKDLRLVLQQLSDL